MTPNTSAREAYSVPFRSFTPFLLISFGMAWGILGLYIFLPERMGTVFGQLTGNHPLFFLAVYAPAIAAFILVVRNGGIAGLRRFLGRTLLWRCSAAWYAFLIIGIPLIFMSGSALRGNLFTEPFPFVSIQVLLSDAGIITLSHKPMNLGAVLLGGALFGTGWAVMGFCPGTSIGALGEGRWHAIFAVAGMVTGAALYAELFPFIRSTVLAWKDFGKIGLPEVMGVSPWVIIPFFWAGTISLFFWFEKKASSKELPRSELREMNPAKSKDLLASPQELASREQSMNVAITLRRKSIDVFKSDASKNDAQYQRMMRLLLDTSVDSQSEPLHTVWGVPKGESSPAVLVAAYRPGPRKRSKVFLPFGKNGKK